MKACPSCGRLYPTDARFCPVDGESLDSATQVPVVPDSGDPRIGQLLLERYEIRRAVADGGMGRVYEALDLTERRSVAVKILHDEIAQDPVQVERFRQEFAVNQLLSHEHIVEVFDFCELEGGSMALIMEFLFGEELRQTLDRETAIPAARICRLISQVAIGLDKAHASQLVHRDLKPDNLFLCQTPDGDMVKILDFGSVKDKSQSSRNLTVMGTTIGSPYYMAPEQAQALDTLDHRADIWALGAILYECMAGRVPFSGANGPQILLSILTKEAPRVSEVVNPLHPIAPGMDKVLARAFKKTASLRYDSVGALADAVGHAYGLRGDYRLWSTTREGELQAEINAQITGLLSERPPPPRANAQDDFFGESDSLGESSMPPQASAGPAVAAPAVAAPAVPRVPLAAPADGAGESPEDLPLDLPLGNKAGPPAWLFLLIALGALGLLWAIFG